MGTPKRALVRTRQEQVPRSSKRGTDSSWNNVLFTCLGARAVDAFSFHLSLGHVNLSVLSLYLLSQTYSLEIKSDPVAKPSLIVAETGCCLGEN